MDLFIITVILKTVNNHFKIILNKKQNLRKKSACLNKHVLVFPDHEILSLQTKTKWKTSIKSILICCKHIVFKSQNKTNCSSFPRSHCCHL